MAKNTAPDVRSPVQGTNAQTSEFVETDAAKALAILKAYAAGLVAPKRQAAEGIAASIVRV